MTERERELLEAMAVREGFASLPVLCRDLPYTPHQLFRDAAKLVAEGRAVRVVVNPGRTARYRITDAGRTALCSCPHVMIGSTVHPSTNWSDECAIHGVGTDFFRNLKVKPFGYRDEGSTTREEWTAWKGEK